MVTNVFGEAVISVFSTEAFQNVSKSPARINGVITQKTTF
jgi:hypothetical protein